MNQARGAGDSRIIIGIGSEEIKSASCVNDPVAIAPGTDLIYPVAIAPGTDLIYPVGTAPGTDLITENEPLGPDDRIP